jgi:uncharacterized protein YyaL (SSP411 family)
MANRLAKELSPYLRQHAHNPVDWYPWGEEALKRAEREQKPILLSIGYSACHWCHVMERESFDDPGIAALMNEHFVSIKVDREERPDLDKVYQTAVQLMTRRSGGWPLTVFLTPDRRPFFGGTYFPPVDRHGMPGFTKVLRSVAHSYAEDRRELDAMAEQVLEALGELDASESGRELGQDVAIEAARKLGLRFDERHGGFGVAPKFPNTFSLDIMLRAYRRSMDPQWLERARKTADAMIDGGIHDQIGGGFHRYATDERWLVPHFEKMLYDNALIGRLLVDLWRVTREPRYRQTCAALLSYVEREMSSPEGGFFSSQDADSEGREGAFFVWTPEQLQAVLSPEQAELAQRYWGVDEVGNFEGGTTVLHVTRPFSALAQTLGLQHSEAQSALEEARQRLFEARQSRPKPFRDEKIITSWNAMMISAFCEAGAAFAEPARRDRAKKGLRFLKDRMWDGDVLFRIYKDGSRGGRGFLVDYAELANAAMDFYEASFETEYLDWAAALLDSALSRFWDADSATLYFNEQGEDLIVRSQDHVDNAVPSGTSSMLRALLRLQAFVAKPRYAEVSEQVLEQRAGSALDNPFAHGALVGVVDAWLRGSCQIVLSSEKDAAPGQWDWAAELVRSTFVLDRALMELRRELSGAEAALGSGDRPPGVYVCRDRTCSPPVSDPEALRGLLEAGF